MKKVITIILLIIFLSTEITILYKDNVEYTKTSEKLTSSAVSYESVLEDISSLEKEKSTLKEEITSLLAAEAFNEDDVKEYINNETVVNETLEKEITELESNISLLEGNLQELQKEYNALIKKREEEQSYYITGVANINQYPDYPTGCESVALTILLNYYGVAISPLDVINRLPKGSILYQENGVTYGGNPEVEFVGNPLSENSFGVYERPIAKVANTFKSGINIATGTSFEDILKVVKSGRPVIVWTSMGLSVPYISTSWIYKPTGERIYWKAGEHAVVIIGYTSNQVIVSDPIGGKVKYYQKSTFKDRYNYFGKKALYY